MIDVLQPQNYPTSILCELGQMQFKYITADRVQYEGRKCEHGYQALPTILITTNFDLVHNTLYVNISRVQNGLVVVS